MYIKQTLDAHRVGLLAISGQAVFALFVAFGLILINKAGGASPHGKPVKRISSRSRPCRHKTK
ncbi:MAG: hypothetical protein CVT75_01170 [Alphaproteobacteria bacterium HGW-Alphaproteobacteria-14]|nr:MAG: hypothetical protein CVT75_01170 [Alphaproteobacteria bacterium HGW-Alphaproteobacteria-14]